MSGIDWPNPDSAVARSRFLQCESERGNRADLFYGFLTMVQGIAVSVLAIASTIKKSERHGFQKHLEEGQILPGAVDSPTPPVTGSSGVSIFAAVNEHLGLK